MDITQFDLGIVGDSLGLSASALSMIFLVNQRKITQRPLRSMPRPTAPAQQAFADAPPAPPAAPVRAIPSAGGPSARRDIGVFKADIQDLSARFDVFEERWRTEMSALERSLEGSSSPAGASPRDKATPLGALEAEGAQLENAVRAAEEKLRRIQEELRALTVPPEGGLSIEAVLPASDLVFGISHQLRTPLAVARSVSESSLAAGWLTAEHRRAFETIIQSVETMNQRLEELVEFSKPPLINPQMVDFPEFLEKTTLLVDEACRKGGVILELELPSDLPRLRLDPYQFQIAFLHLFFNAIEAMPKGGTLSVETTWDPIGATASVRVRDTGEGIAAEQLAEVLQPFFSTKPGGTGLGLCIARRVFQAHGGDLRIASAQGKGTEVLCWFKGV